MEHEEDEEPPLAVQIQGNDEFVSQKSSVGVTLITGYLGAGKSTVRQFKVMSFFTLVALLLLLFGTSSFGTLVNHILNSQHGKRIAVILNEFGEEIGVERAMINEGDKGALVEEWVELANGCICCTVKHSLVQALEQLVQRKESGPTLLHTLARLSSFLYCVFRLDHILLETTGLANPAPLASVLWLDEQLESEVKLDSIVTVVDAKNLRFQLDEHRDSSSFPEAYFQIAFADTIILNKVDLVSAESSGALEKLEEEIHNINSLAEIIHSVRCQVDLSRILNRQAYDTARATHLETLLEESRSLSTKKLHDSGVRTICISGTQMIDLDKTRIWLEEILWEKKYDMDVYRCKGVLSVQNSDQLHTLQAVRELYEIVPSRKWEKEEKRINKIVFIGTRSHSLLAVRFADNKITMCTQINKSKNKEKFKERTTSTTAKPKDKESSNGIFLQERRYARGVSRDPIKERLEEDPSELKRHEN
ncbi:hypothetical protein V8G54_014883 [Vigna mungo]|uniref:CobW C-terminal domain-containing protein n=1 Tax=Vigna mungo TaxID=3915 RepID=A0AAQ3RYZ2_VIGMU